MSSFGLWIASIVNKLRAHSHIWINPKMDKFIESKSSTWQNIADLNMNKRSSWNNPETIWTSVKRVIANCLWLDFGRTWH